jgi:peptidoglycan/xylan/chitin deacetylase (PgdA/CDA1 family)
MAAVDGIGALARSVKQALPGPLRDAARRARRAATWLPRRLIGTVTGVRTDQAVAALTFDDGPDPRATPRLLELLEAHGARATFFLIGRAAERHPALVERIAAGGHAIANHSYDHRSFPQLRARERRAQIRAWQRACGGASRLLRPPYGDQTLLSRLDPLWLGWEVVTWDICGKDWRGEDAGTIAERILEELHPGAIVLLHDSLYHCEDERFVSREPTIEAVARVLEAAPQYRFVTVPELLRLGPARRELWVQPGEPDYLENLKRVGI